MTPSSWTVNSTSSPSLMCSPCLIASGKVSCAFGRSLARALVRGRTSFSAPASFKNDSRLCSALLGKSNFLEAILARDSDMRPGL